MQELGEQQTEVQALDRLLIKGKITEANSHSLYGLLCFNFCICTTVAAASHRVPVCRHDLTKQMLDMSAC